MLGQETVHLKAASMSDWAGGVQAFPKIRQPPRRFQIVSNMDRNAWKP